MMTLEACWLDTLRQLMRCPVLSSRDGDMYEMLGWSFAFQPAGLSLLHNRVRNMSHAYAAAETLWYLSGRSDVQMLLPYAPSYERFAESDGRAYGAYGPRICKQLHDVIDCLRVHTNTRQAVLAIWSPDDIAKAGKVRDIPCTLSWQFLLRDNALHMIVTMRSNDIWLGFPYDVCAFTIIQQLVANELGCQVGTYRHQVGSMHLYSRNLDKARQALESEVPYCPTLEPLTDTFDDVESAIRIEELARTQGALPSQEMHGQLAPISAWMVQAVTQHLLHRNE